MTKKILIVDDEPNIRKMVQKYASHCGYDVDEASSGEACLSCLEEKQYDLIIMDVMMPIMDGYQTVASIRKTSKIPILMLTAKDQIEDRIHGLSLWVDDYVVKPFSLKELMLRIEAILNRSSGKTSPLMYVYEGLTINDTSRIVTVDNIWVDLSSKEFELLVLLVRNQGRTLLREQCIEAVWGSDFDPLSRTLDTHIKLLRQKLGSYGVFIKTSRGEGYRFEA